MFKGFLDFTKYPEDQREINFGCNFKKKELFVEFNEGAGIDFLKAFEMSVISLGVS